MQVSLFGVSPDEVPHIVQGTQVSILSLRIVPRSTTHLALTTSTGMIYGLVEVLETKSGTVRAIWSRYYSQLTALDIDDYDPEDSAVLVCLGRFYQGAHPITRADIGLAGDLKLPLKLSGITARLLYSWADGLTPPGYEHITKVSRAVVNEDNPMRVRKALAEIEQAGYGEIICRNCKQRWNPKRPISPDLTPFVLSWMRDHNYLCQHQQ